MSLRHPLQGKEKELHNLILFHAFGTCFLHQFRQIHRLRKNSHIIPQTIKTLNQINLRHRPKTSPLVNGKITVGKKLCSCQQMTFGVFRPSGRQTHLSHPFGKNGNLLAAFAPLGFPYDDASDFPHAHGLTPFFIKPTEKASGFLRYVNKILYISSCL